MQLEYLTSLPRGLHGDIASTRPAVKRARVYPKQKKIVTVGVGGADNGTYTIRIETPEGDLPLSPIDSSFVASGASADDLIEALVDAINSGAAAPNLRGIVKATADLDNDQIAIEAMHAGKDFTVSFPSNPSTNLTQSLTQAHSVDNLPLGVGMVDVDGLKCALPGSSASADDFLGLVARGRGIEGQDDGSAEFHQAGDNLDLLVEGDVFIMPEDDVEVTDDVYWKVEATTGTLGAFRGTPDGSAQVSTFVPTVNLSLYGLSLSVKDADGHVRDFSVTYQPTDGTTAVADAIDGLFDAIVDALGGATSAENGFGVTVTESDTALTFTTDAGVAIVDLSSSVWAGDTEAVTGVATIGTADVDAVKLPKSRAKWIRGGGPTSGECAVLALNE